VIPFRLVFQPGVPVYEQVKFAATKAIISGQIRPGDPFPSVRALSKELKINPNTAHKVVVQLTDDGLLEIRPGIGAVVASPPPTSRAEKGGLLGRELEQLAVEAKRLGLSLESVQSALAEHWRRLEKKARKETA
jgi:GntR family transcriptional regulator